MNSRGPLTVRNVGMVREATTLDGYKVYRKERLFLKTFKEEFPEGVPCAPYDNHFAYMDPSKKKGRWSPMCTCGSPAGVVNYDAYKQDASNVGALIVCLSHSTTGRHSDGSQ